MPQENLTTQTTSKDNTTHLETVTPSDIDPVQGPPAEDLNKDGTDIVSFAESGTPAVTSGQEQSFAEEFEHIIPDQLDKSVATILSRYSKHNDYSFTPNDYFWNVHYLIENMQQFHKLDGYYGFTATYSMKIVWNSDPFVQGIYMLAYLPPGPEPNLSLFQPAEKPVYESVFFSGCPRTIFNLNTSSSAQLDIPYVGTDAFITFGEHWPRLLGTFYLIPLSTAQGPNCFTDLKYTVYFALKNLKTVGARPALADFPLGARHAEMQAPEAEVKKDKLSTFLGATTSFLNSFGSAFPAASAVTKPASWLTGGAAKIADFIGLSKPFANGSLKPVAEMSYLDVTTSDASFCGAKMAVNVDAGISKIDLTGRKVDDLDIHTILSRKEVIPRTDGTTFDKVYVWKTTDAIGTKLFKQEIGPSYFTASYTRPNGDVIDVNNHMSYLSKLFGKWRGSIKFSLMFASTRFQTGRLRVMFIPKSTNDFDDSMLPYAYTQIVDIREPSTWDFDIPFISPKVWLHRTASVGTLVISVENPLLAACSVLQHVEIVTFVSAGPSFEFALPNVMHDWRPLVEAITQPTMQSYSPEQLTQMLAPATDFRTFETETAVGLKMSPKDETKSTTAHQLSVGDPIRSLRPLLKKFWIGADPVWTSGTDKTIIQYPTPAYIFAEQNSADMDFIYRIAVMYGFYRGGFRVYAQNYFPARAFTFYTNLYASNTSTCGQARNQVPYDQVSTFAAIGASEPSKFEVPYSSNTLCSSIWMDDLASNPQMALALEYYVGDAGIIVSRACADDFDMGFLIGAPVTINSLGSRTSTTQPKGEALTTSTDPEKPTGTPAPTPKKQGEDLTTSTEDPTLQKRPPGPMSSMARP